MFCRHLNVIIFRLFLITLLQLSLRQLGRLGFQFPPVEQSNVFFPITTKSINGAFQETCALDELLMTAVLDIMKIRLLTVKNLEKNS